MSDEPSVHDVVRTVCALLEESARVHEAEGRHALAQSHRCAASSLNRIAI